MGFELFKYYGYLFKWTLLTIPMGFIGYYIKKNNIISVIILMPALILLSFLGLGYLDSALHHFPNHLLSFVSCFAIIIITVLNLFDKTKLRILAFVLTILFASAFLFLKGGFLNTEFEVIKSINEYNIQAEELSISSYKGTDKGDVKLIPYENSYNIKLMGREKGKYNFTLIDENKKEYLFEYYFDKKQNTVILKKTN